MPIGIIINVLSVALGGLTGSLVGNRLSEKVKEEMNLIFGICAMGMGMGSVCLMQNMPAVVFSVIMGFCPFRHLLDFFISQLLCYCFTKHLDFQQGCRF